MFSTAAAAERRDLLLVAPVVGAEQRAPSNGDLLLCLAMFRFLCHPAPSVATTPGSAPSVCSCVRSAVLVFSMPWAGPGKRELRSSIRSPDRSKKGYTFNQYEVWNVECGMCTMEGTPGTGVVDSPGQRMLRCYHRYYLGWTPRKRSGWIDSDLHWQSQRKTPVSCHERGGSSAASGGVEHGSGGTKIWVFAAHFEGLGSNRTMARRRNSSGQRRRRRRRRCRRRWSRTIDTC